MRLEYYEIQKLLSHINTVTNQIENFYMQGEGELLKLSTLYNNALKTVYTINQSLYLTECPLFLKEILNGLMDIRNWSRFISLWENEIIDTIAQRTSLPVIDADFLQIMDFISGSDENQIIQFMIQNLEKLRQHDEVHYQNLKKYYSIYERMWGQIDIDTENISALKDRAFQLKEHQEDFFWLYQRLSDYRSKQVLLSILSYWLTYDIFYLNQCSEQNFSDYFDPDLILADENEVFIDAGAWRGDTVKDFIRVYGNYKKIYCFEITPESLIQCQTELSSFENIAIIPKALGKEKGNLFLKYYGLDNTSNSLSTESGDIEVEVTTLDSEITEPITWIKMDIEGAEQSAILGAKEHITKERPKLTICTYHNNEDIWKIPRMIDEMRNDYQFYMRYNGDQLGATEFVFFAL